MNLIFQLGTLTYCLLWAVLFFGCSFMLWSGVKLSGVLLYIWYYIYGCRCNTELK